MSKDLRLATSEDLPALLLLVMEAQKETPFNLPFSAERVLQVLNELLQNGIVICYIRNDQIAGLICGLTTYTPASLELIAAELLWYVHPDHRKSRGALKLMDAFEYWAWTKGCSAVTIGNIANTKMDATGKLYERKGYRLVEQSYMKNLK